jgi:hypothetical protein
MPTLCFTDPPPHKKSSKEEEKKRVQKAKNLYMLFIKKNPTMCQNFIIPHLYEAQHVSDDTPPIIRSLKLHGQLLVFQF